MRLSKETGGGFFEVSKKLGIEQIFDLIQEELRSQFSIGYVSDEPVRISEFRKIQLTAKQLEALNGPGARASAAETQARPAQRDGVLEEMVAH